MQKAKKLLIKKMKVHNFFSNDRRVLKFQSIPGKHLVLVHSRHYNDVLRQ